MYYVRKKITEIMQGEKSPSVLCSELQRECSIFGEQFKIISTPDPQLPYTCLQYCTNCLEDSVERYNTYMRFRDFHKVSEIDMKFLEWLIKGGFFIATEKSKASFVTYWENLKPQHIGMLQKDDFIISKWGVGGPLVKHGVFQTPSIYGSIAKWHDWSGKYEITQLIDEFVDCLHSTT